MAPAAQGPNKILGMSKPRLYGVLAGSSVAQGLNKILGMFKSRLYGVLAGS